MRRHILIALLALLTTPAIADDEPLTVAVSSNFANTLGELAARFYVESGIVIRMSAGSTGKLFAQIHNGAPFDVFLAADSERPARLEESGFAVEGSRFTYARGQLALWSLNFDDCHEALVAGGWIALANPKTAPFGRAAREYLQTAGVWSDVKGRIAYGENVMQTMQFAVSGGADVGVVARSVLHGPHIPSGNCVWPVPEQYHAPIEQQAVLLMRAQDNDVALQFLEFLRSDTAHEIIVQHGYGATR